MNRKQKTEEKGVTLIALVITIVVLLILAGVSIATLSGNNGILTQAEKAKKENSEVSEKEKIQMEVAGSFDDTGKYNFSKIIENLRKNLNIDEEKIGMSETQLTVEYNDKVYVINTNGKVTEQGIAEEISMNASTYYGSEISGYDCQSRGVSKWRIFYSDESNIYIIADDYIYKEYVPNSRKR